jgi:hypothetical protein
MRCHRPVFPLVSLVPIVPMVGRRPTFKSCSRWPGRCAARGDALALHTVRITVRGCSMTRADISVRENHSKAGADLVAPALNSAITVHGIHLLLCRNGRILLVEDELTRP